MVCDTVHEAYIIKIIRRGLGCTVSNNNKGKISILLTESLFISMNEFACLVHPKFRS